MKLLFVCTGNTCRSPMAEGMMKQIAAQKGLKIEAKSAGVAAMTGGPASVHTDTILKARGIHDSHSSQLVSPELVEWADFILTMTKGHKDSLLRYFPAAIPKTYTIKEFAVGDVYSDVSDPYGGSLEVYKETEKELESILYKIVTKLAEM